MSRRRRTGQDNPGPLTTGRAGTDIATGDRAWRSLASSRADDFVGRTRHTKTEYPCTALPGTSTPPPRVGGGAGTSLSGEASFFWGRSTFRRAASTLANAAPMASRATSLCGSSHALWLLRALSSSGPALSPCLAPAPSQVTVSRRRCPGGTAVIAASIPCEVAGGGVRPGAALARHRGRRPGGVIAVGRQRSAGRIFDAGLGR